MTNLRTVVISKSLYLLAFVGALYLSGCSFHLLKLQTERNRYLPADTVKLTLYNGTMRRIGYNLCGAILERYSDGKWQYVRPKVRTSCKSILWVVRPLGTSKAWMKGLPQNLPAGRYRFATRVRFYSGGRSGRIGSAPFTVTRPNQAKGLQRTILVPTRLRVEPTPRGYWVSVDTTAQKTVSLSVRPGLVVGVRTDLSIVARNASRGPKVLSGGLGGRVDIGRTLVPTASLPKSVAKNDLLLRLAITVFETDVPVQHLWNPGSGKRYRTLWTGVVKWPLVARR